MDNFVIDENNADPIVIRDENRDPIEIISLQTIQWDLSFQPGQSFFYAVHHGTFGLSPKYEFALKRLKKDLTLDDCNAEYWSQLNSDYIVKLFLHGRFTVKTLQLNNELMLITEFCNGGSLSDLIQKHFPGGLDVHYYGLLMQCLLNSLGYLGAQNPPLLTRHIMPSKILLHKQPNGNEIFKLNGFANIHFAPSSKEIWKAEDYVTGYSRFMQYCHPRVLKKYLNMDDEVTNSDKKYLDLYSAGTLLYVAATGKDPIRLSAPTKFEEMYQKLLEAYNLKENDSEVLSMFQEPDNSSWILEYDFPERLPLSSVPGLLPELRKLIVNLLQVNQKKIMPFNDFVDESERILWQYISN